MKGIRKVTKTVTLPGTFINTVTRTEARRVTGTESITVSGTVTVEAFVKN